MIHVLEGVVHRPRPHVWPGHVMADALFVKLEHVPRPFFMAHLHSQRHLVSKLLPKIAYSFVMRGPALGVHGGFLLHAQSYIVRQ